MNLRNLIFLGCFVFASCADPGATRDSQAFSGMVDLNADTNINAVGAQFKPSWELQLAASIRRFDTTTSARVVLNAESHGGGASGLAGLYLSFRRADHQSFGMSENHGDTPASLPLAAWDLTVAAPLDTGHIVKLTWQGTSPETGVLFLRDRWTGRIIPMSGNGSYEYRQRGDASGMEVLWNSGSLLDIPHFQAADVPSASVIVTNPVTDGRALFRFFAPEHLSRIRIDIYTLVAERARELDVRSLTPSSISAGKVAYDIPFDCRNQSGRPLASGIYICAFIATSGTGKTFRIPPTKLALIRGSSRGVSDDMGGEKSVPPPIQPSSSDSHELQATEDLNRVLAQLSLVQNDTDVFAQVALRQSNMLIKKYRETHAAAEAQLALFTWELVHGRTEAAQARLRALEETNYPDVRVRAEAMRMIFDEY